MLNIAIPQAGSRQLGRWVEPLPVIALFRWVEALSMRGDDVSDIDARTPPSECTMNIFYVIGVVVVIIIVAGYLGVHL